MYTALPSPFASVRTFVFRLNWAPASTVAAPAKPRLSEAARRHKKRLKKQAKAERLRNFFGWCAGWEAYGSIF
jgi:hypothetical protein